MNYASKEFVHELRFRHFAEKDAGALAITDADGHSWTRAALAERANRLSRALRDRGCGKKSVVALIAPNSSDFLVSYLAATQIGMYVVPINWHLAAPEIQYIIENCSASAILAHSRFRTLFDGVTRQLACRPNIMVSLGGAIPDCETFESFTAGYSGATLQGPVQGRVLSYTSATTGRPKGVILPLEDADRVLDLSISARISAGTFPEEHVQLCASMLYHGAPLEGVVVSLHMGHSVVLMEQLEPEDLLLTIDRYRVTLAYIVPSMFSRLLMLSNVIRDKYSGASLRKVVHVGAACPVEIKKKMIEWWGPVLIEVYGATEGSGTAVNSEEWMKYPGTVGRPMAGTKLRILGEDGQVLPPNSIGTVYLTRYSGDRYEYLNDPEKTRASYLGEYFTVGDMGYLNADGYLFLCDRKTDVINISGSKVYPAEIENLLLECSQVADCAVVGIPDPRFGEAILALICPANSSMTRDELRRDLVRMLRQHVSITKIPRYFEILESIPRDSSGKIQKKKLREHYAALASSRKI